jgi:hypothetical protein
MRSRPAVAEISEGKAERAPLRVVADIMLMDEESKDSDVVDPSEVGDIAGDLKLKGRLIAFVVLFEFHFYIP